MSGLYIIFWIIFILVFPSYFLIKFIVNYISLNGKKPLLLIFNKENKLFLGLIFGFTIIFWVAFFSIYYFRITPYLNFSKEGFDTEKEKVYLSEFHNCLINYDCSKIINLNQDNTLEITSTNRDYIKFKLNTSVVVSRCTNCDFTYLKAGKEYKLSKNQNIYFKILDQENNTRYSYDLFLS